MPLTASDAATHLAEVATAVSKAVAEPSLLAALPTHLAGLANRLAVTFEVDRQSDSIVSKAAAQQIVYGWASVCTVNGETVEDLQGDELPTDEMQKSVHDFMQVRAADTMHDEVPVSEIVDSLFVTKALSDAMGWYPGREGWFVGVKVYDADVWKRVESGELKAFSIAGDATSTPILAGV